jgi:hypothetical protein
MQTLLQSFSRLFHCNQVGCCFYFSFAAAAAVGDGTTISFENRKYGRRGLDPQKVIYNFHFIMCKHTRKPYSFAYYTHNSFRPKTNNYSTRGDSFDQGALRLYLTIVLLLLILVVVLADEVVFHVLSFDIQKIPFSLGVGSYLQISLWLMFVCGLSFFFYIEHATYYL